jgi:hypothetical protein
MKGIVFLLAGQAVSQIYGEDVWDDILDEAGVCGAYTTLGNYPDAELGRIVDAASRALDLPPGVIVRWLGEAMVPAFVQHHHNLFALHPDARLFILGLNTIIHPEVHKLYPDAQAPDFAFDASDPHVLSTVYRSERRLCMLAEGLVAGSAAHYGQRVEIGHETCMLRGAAHCQLDLRFFAA